jgi:NAD(P)-dependent dehydrogenase (short-subunit alcohol dehydrogenase family)
MNDQPAALAWFITGASQGLGRRLCEYALEHGETVTATTRNRDALADLADTYPKRLTIEQLDLVDARDVETVIPRVLATGRRVDVVVNNAGYAVIGASEEQTDEEIHRQLRTMLLAPIQISRAVLGPMRAQGGGRIIQISSFGGQMGFPGGTGYHTAKWGLEGFTESLSREVAEFGIFCTIVQPGAIRTNFGSNIVYANASPDYRDSAVAQMRQYVSSADDATYTGDPAKLAQAIFDTTRTTAPPLRLTLGADAYRNINDALSERLRALRAQEELAHAVAITASGTSRRRC